MSSQPLPRWDRQLQRRLAQGEESALAEVYDRFASMVHHLANKIMDDSDAADDITREVFVHIWKNAETFDPKLSSMRSWVASLTHHKSVERLRAVAYEEQSMEQRAGELSGSDLPSGEPAAGEASREPRVRVAEQAEARVHSASTAARADFIVSAMPEPLRQALRLAHNEGHSYRRTATVLGVSEAETRRRLRLGLQLLSTAADDLEAGR